MNEISFLNLKKKLFMNTNRKILDLVNHGFSGTLISELNEGQINSLHKRLTESKKETKEQTPPGVKEIQKTTKEYQIDPGKEMALGNYVVKNQGGKAVVSTTNESDDLENNDIALAVSEKDPNLGLAMSDDLQEKFESKAQQKLFWAKCGEGKTKEQKKWCKLAREFSDSTSKKEYKKMPEKIHPEKTVKVVKKENKEGYLDMVGKAMNKNMMNKISDIRPGLKFESQLQSKIENLVEKYVSAKISKKDLLETIKGKTMNEAGKEVETPVKPGVDTPSKPKPGTPYQPKHQPAPKAGKEVETPVKPGVDTPSKPKPGTPYQPKHQPAPKAKKEKFPSWLSFKSIGINLK